MAVSEVTFFNQKKVAVPFPFSELTCSCPGRGNLEKGGLEKADVIQHYIKASFGILQAVWKQLEE